MLRNVHSCYNVTCPKKEFKLDMYFLLKQACAYGLRASCCCWCFSGASVKSVESEVFRSNVNGHEEASATEIDDILAGEQTLERWRHNNGSKPRVRYNVGHHRWAGGGVAPLEPPRPGGGFARRGRRPCGLGHSDSPASAAPRVADGGVASIKRPGQQLARMGRQ